MDKEKDRNIYFLFLSAVCLIMIQRFSFGGRYYPVMDDWFLYGDTYTAADKLTGFIIPNAKFSIRPLAGMVDIFFIAPLFEHLWIAEAVMTLLLTAGTFLMLSVLRENDFSVGGIFVLLLCLLPLNMEATYWLAASIRISNSMFFTGLAVWLLQKYLTTKKKRFFIGYSAAGFTAVGFYEPAVAVYLFLALYLILKRKNKKLLPILIITAAHIISVAVYYLCNKNSWAMERGAFITTGIASHGAEITKVMANILGYMNVKLFSLGFERGMYLIIHKKAVIQGLAIALHSVLLGIFSGRLPEREREFAYKKILLGLFLGFAGIVVFYVLEDTRITLRSVYFIFIGFGAAIEELLSAIPYRARRIVVTAAVTVLSAACVVSGIGTADKYRQVSAEDVNIVGQIAESDKNDAIYGERKIYLFGAVDYYEDIETLRFFENIRGACSGYSEMTGCMWHFAGTSHKTNITPVKNGGKIALKSTETSAGQAFFALDGGGNVVKVNITQSDAGLEIRDENDNLYGTLITGGDEYVYEESLG